MDKVHWIVKSEIHEIPSGTGKRLLQQPRTTRWRKHRSVRHVAEVAKSVKGAALAVVQFVVLQRCFADATSSRIESASTYADDENGVMHERRMYDMINAWHM